MVARGDAHARQDPGVLRAGADDAGMIAVDFDVSPRRRGAPTRARARRPPVRRRAPAPRPRARHRVARRRRRRDARRGPRLGAAGGRSAASGLELASRDERLWRRVHGAPSSSAVLDAYWTPGARARGARETLRALPRTPRPRRRPICAPFDEAAEDEIHPLLVDAGWELLASARSTPSATRERSARSGTRSRSKRPASKRRPRSRRRPTSCELPAIGPVELLRGADDDGALARRSSSGPRATRRTSTTSFAGVARAPRSSRARRRGR